MKIVIAFVLIAIIVISSFFNIGRLNNLEGIRSEALDDIEWYVDEKIGDTAVCELSILSNNFGTPPNSIGDAFGGQLLFQSTWMCISENQTLNGIYSYYADGGKSIGGSGSQTGPLATVDF
ncbi:MAG: hypothetical protein AAF216_05435 [Pseudomonadota bacterium]